MELESESEELADLVWINTKKAETDAILWFKIAEYRHGFCSKSHVKGLGMNCVIGWFFCLHFQLWSTNSYSIASNGIRGGIRRKRKHCDPCDSDSVELTIAIPFLFVIHTEWKVPFVWFRLCFRFHRQCEPALISLKKVLHYLLVAIFRRNLILQKW